MSNIETQRIDKDKDGNEKITVETSLGKKIGSKWSYRLYFITAEKGKGKYLQVNELPKIYLDEYSEKIDHVWLYTTPLSKYQRSSLLFHHAFIIFKSTSFYWSIEKTGKGIIVQVYRDLADVYKVNAQGQPRYEKIKLVGKEKDGIVKVSDVIDDVKLNETDDKYNLYFSNCQHFARRIYRIISKGKKDYKREYDIKVFIDGHDYNIDDFPDDFSWKLIEKPREVWIYEFKDHRFVVFNTATRSWSVELMGKSAVIQVSTNIYDVRDKDCNGEPRLNLITKEHFKIDIPDTADIKEVYYLIRYMRKSYNMQREKKHDDASYASLVFQYLTRVGRSSNSVAKLFFTLKEYKINEYFNIEQLPNQYKHLLSGTITNVTLYESMLEQEVPACDTKKYEFIIFCSGDYYWSVDRDGCNTIIQVSSKERDVLGYQADGKKRNTKTYELKTGKSIFTVRDCAVAIIKFVIKRAILIDTYNVAVGELYDLITDI